MAEETETERTEDSNGLLEIILTNDGGYVLKGTNEPVEILGGKHDCGRITKNDPEIIRRGIEESIREVYSKDLPSETNGYVIHLSQPIIQYPSDIPSKKWNVMTAFSAVKYRMATKSV